MTSHPPFLRFVTVSSRLESLDNQIIPAADIDAAMTSGRFQPQSEVGLPGILLTRSVDTALIAVDRDGDFIAEAVIAVENGKIGELAIDLPSYDPGDDEWPEVWQTDNKSGPR